MRENIYSIKLKQVELDKEFVEKENELNVIRQEFADKLEKIRLDESLSREEAEQKTKLSLQEAQNKIEFIYTEQMVKFEKARQEIRNIMNGNDILARLIDELPEIAERMPQIQELKVFQTNQNDPVLDSLINFVNKILAVSDTLGIKLPIGKEGKKKE
mgnify:FL=1